MCKIFKFSLIRFISQIGVCKHDIYALLVNEVAGLGLWLFLLVSRFLLGLRIKVFSVFVRNNEKFLSHRIYANKKGDDCSSPLRFTPAS